MIYTEVATIRETAKRAQEANLGIGECFLRRACKEGKLKHTLSGSKTLIYWPNLLEFLQIGEQKPVPEEEHEKIRRIDV